MCMQAPFWDELNISLEGNPTHVILVAIEYADFLTPLCAPRM